jgi:hypothetical protein
MNRRRHSCRWRGRAFFWLEVLIGGLMAGVLYALVALGFVLIFKASGVFNFAQGAMVLFAALSIRPPVRMDARCGHRAGQRSGTPRSWSCWRVADRAAWCCAAGQPGGRDRC